MIGYRVNASGHMRTCEGHQGRDFCPAVVLHTGAAVGVGATGRPCAGPGRTAGDAEQHLGSGGRGSGSNQTYGVRVPRRIEDCRGVSAFDDTTRIEDCCVVSKVSDHGEVVTYVDRRHLIAVGKFPDGLQDPFLGVTSRPVVGSSKTTT